MDRGTSSNLKVNFLSAVTAQQADAVESTRSALVLCTEALQRSSEQRPPAEEGQRKSLEPCICYDFYR